MSDYLTHRERIETTLRYLESHGLPVGPLWAEHARRIDGLDTETPTEFDKRYELPVDRPTIPEHFNGKTPQTLTAGHAWVGYSYSLTAGQRAWLRDNYGLTPTATITLLEIVRWPGTRHPRLLHLRSDLHVDPRHRRHVLVNAVIRTPGKFFAESAARDAELEAAKLKEDLEREAKGEKPKTITRKRTVDANDYLAELEAEISKLV